MPRINDTEVSSPVYAVVLIVFFLLCGAVAYLIFRSPLSGDSARIDEMIADGTWKDHIRDGRYFGHYSCNWGSTTSIEVTVKKGVMESIKVLSYGRSSTVASDYYRREMLRTQQPPRAFASGERRYCEMRGAVHHAVMNADFDTRTKPYHPTSKEPPRGP